MRVNVGVLDHGGLIELFGCLEGRKLLGAVDCGDCVELVFDDLEPGENFANLISIYTDAGRHTGRVALGGVEDPRGYVAEHRQWLEEAA